MITQQELGSRIRTARTTCGLTQEDLAQELEIPRSAIAQIEAGNRSVSSLELDKLAHHLGRDIRQFFAASFEGESSLGALFRARQDVIGMTPSIAEKLRECLALGRELTNLEQLLGIDRDLTAMATYPLPAPRTRWEAIQQGLRLAADERRRLGLSSVALPDLGDLLEMQGVRTGVIDLPEDVSGLTLSDREVGPFVVVNRTHPYLRRRFSLAHEYAHVVADRERLGLVSLASERDDLVELRANSFAANFLMPEDGMKQVVASLGKGKPSRSQAEVFDESGVLHAEGRSAPGSQSLQLYDVVQVAHHFEVSRLSALFRLRNLRLLSEAELDRLKTLETAGKGRQLAALLGLPEPDPTEVRDAFRFRFLGLALEAYRREEVSRAKLLELASMVKLAESSLQVLLEDTGLYDAQAVFPTP